MHKLYIVGIGPGNYEQMTIRAAEVLKTCDVIVGYTVYIDLIREHFGEKEFLTTPMRQEVKRCEMAFETALSRGSVGSDPGSDGSHRRGGGTWSAADA